MMTGDPMTDVNFFTSIQNIISLHKPVACKYTMALGPILSGVDDVNLYEENLAI